MSEFENINSVLNYRANRIITKRVEPYDVIESVKKFYDSTEYTFTGRNKFETLDNFLSDLKKSTEEKPTMGLYMKNVNKFYLLSIKENEGKSGKSDTELLHELLLTQEYGITEDEQINQNGIIYSDDLEFSLEQIDMGKAEALFILV